MAAEKNVPPPGLELQFTQSYDPESRSPFIAIALAVHWSTVTSTNLRLTSPSSTPTEQLPKTWSSLEPPSDSSSKYIALEYKNALTNKTVNVKIQELAVGGLVAVMSQSEGEKASVITIEAEEFVNCDNVRNGNTSFYDVYRVDKLWDFRKMVKDKVLGKEEEPKKIEVEEDTNPYSSSMSKSKKQSLDARKKETDDLKESLRIGRVTQPQRNPRGLGSSDLDPFSDLTPGSGMLMDPRGFRRPQLPQGIIPGARFDPIGGFGPRGVFPPGAPRLPFGFPDPDHAKPHGFDDMFS